MSDDFQWKTQRHIPERFLYLTTVVRTPNSTKHTPYQNIKQRHVCHINWDAELWKLNFDYKLKGITKSNVRRNVVLENTNTRPPKKFRSKRQMEIHLEKCKIQMERMGSNFERRPSTIYNQL
jgi:hypothetical protein